MGALYGEYDHVIDPKSRIFIPSRFRQELQKEDKAHFMLTVGFDRSLSLFLPSKWDELISNNMEIFKYENKEEERAFKRYFFGNAVDAALDEQGRILLPAKLKTFAGLKKEIVIRGVGNKAEIWDAQCWLDYKKLKVDPSLEKFSKIFDL
ncbi:MAG: division/cell wall cluster transcriptional repressor MraZ [Elusimicrobiales bacterium]|jgi:MraZ protein|nr:division/cell wall cluster transcriptional repressor MraZ [Elusimicrobiales bacterium]